jgi:hypothetical protein
VSRFHKEPFRASGRQLVAQVGLATGVVATALSLRSKTATMQCWSPDTSAPSSRQLAARVGLAAGSIHLGNRLLAQRFLVDQKFPNRDDDKNGQSDAIPDHAGLADLFLFYHAILLVTLLLPRELVAGDFSPARHYR